jgi:hypothetical protein
MVASEAISLACRSLKLDSIVTKAEKLTRMDNKAKPLPRSETTVGWISRNNLHSGRGRVFFLTSLFIELIDPYRLIGADTISQRCAVLRD